MQFVVGMMSKIVRAASPALVFAGAAFIGAAGAQGDATRQGGPTAGEHIYMNARCYACHGQYGFGGVGPRFRKDHFLSLTEYVVGQILVGRGVMPSFAQTLDDKQIAEVASYIRSSWGNDFGDVNPQEVAQVRNQLKEKAPPEPKVTASEQSPGAPTPPPGGGSPGQALPPPSMR